MEKLYLGLSISHNSSACIYSDERGVLAAISQERLNGQKNTKEIPFEAMIACCKVANVTKLDRVAITHYEAISEDWFKKYSEYKLVGDNYSDYIYNHLIANGIEVDSNVPVAMVNHHSAHAFSTFGFYGAPKKPHYTITSDGFGHGESGRIMVYGVKVSDVGLKNSVGLVYQFVTGALGFTELKHEGKITGLAAFGTPKYLNDFENLYEIIDHKNGLMFKSHEYQLTVEELDKVAKSKIVDFDEFLKVRKAVYMLVNKLVETGATREDIAASVQEFAEKYTLLWISNSCVPGLDAYLAGGLFANVKINQRIKDMKTSTGERFFKNVYVCPAMGDEGTAVGAAIAISDEISYTVPGINPAVCGTRVDESEVFDTFLRTCPNPKDYKITILSDPINYVSKNLAENKIVCLMRDKMEFGPRALCHRSILYNADSRETNDWLNKKLSRTEFMPFAPVTREEVADDLFVGLDGGRDSAKYMTMTFDCTPEFAENYKAACHIDNTARPQIISKSDDEFMWNVLKKYQDLTGKKAMINTSFNLHNNPIIESIETAICSWLTSDTDVLVIENIAIEKR